MNALIPMEDVSTIVQIQLAATIVYVLLVILLMMTIIIQCSCSCKINHIIPLSRAIAVATYNKIDK